VGRDRRNHVPDRWLILVADAIWLIYRIVKGWLYLNENKPLP
jgi:uncharacterized membrane protein